MRKTIKLSLTLILACVMLFAVAMVASAAEPTASGDIGNNSSIKWEYFDSTKTMVISGTGRMLDFQATSDVPYASYAKKVETLIIESGITKIGRNAFNAFSAITEVTIPDTVETIGAYAFRGCSKLTEIHFGSGVKTVGAYAFINIKQLSGNEKVYITDLAKWCAIDFKSWQSNPVAWMCGALYLNGEKIENLVFPDTVSKIMPFTFMRNYGLISITLPDNITNVGKYAFAGCRKMTTVNIDNCVVQYGSSAFASCDVLRNVYINNIATFGKSTFDAMTAHPAWKNGTYMNIDGIKYQRADSFTGDGTQSLVIPQGVTDLNPMTFQTRSRLKTITLPESLVNVSSVAAESPFRYSSKITTVKGVTGTTAETFAKGRNWQFQSITPVLPTSISTSNNMVDQILNIGDEPITFTASVVPSNSTYKSIVWYSSDLSVVRVTAGVVTAYGPGTATVTAKTTDGSCTASCTITVPAIAVEGIALDATTAELEAGHKLTLIPTITPAKASNKAITWTSSNKAVATVNAKGVVTPVADGEATITATTADGSFVATCVVTVTGFVVVPDTVAVTGVELDTEAASLKVDETVQLTATVAPADATNKEVIWSTNAADVATVNNGLVTAVGAGNAIITVTTVDGGFTDTCTIVVLPKVVPATSVTLNETEIELEVDGTATLVATILPDDATETDVVWTSDAESVATVDGGVVTAVGAGTATIKATVGAVYAECIVTVKAPDVFVAPSYITLVGQDDNGTLVLNLAPGQTYEPVIEFWTEDGEVASAVELGWYVSDLDAVSVENGVITANAVASGVFIEILALDEEQYPDIYGYIEIEVSNILVTDITLNKTELSMALEGINQTFQLEATVAPADATDPTFTWASSDITVATVDENGLVTAVGEGTAEITATANDEGGAVATCIVKVAAGSETPIDPWNN